jgi:hypothetical protein
MIPRHSSEVDQVLAFMTKHGLSFRDLTEIGGQDLKSLISIQREKARRVAKCWALIARIGVAINRLLKAHDFVQLEAFAAAIGSLPEISSRRPRHRAVERQTIETTEVSGFDPLLPNPNEINDLANSGPVAVSDLKSQPERPTL